MKKIEDQISLIHAAASTQDIFARFVKIMHDYGYDQVSYSCVTDCPSLGLQKKHGHISNFNSGWLEHYAKNNLADIDPVHMHTRTAATPTFWSSCEKNAAPSSIQLMRDAADVGLKSGIAIPLREGKNEISAVSIARDIPASEERYETLAAINLLSAYFYEGYKSFLKKPDVVALTSREYEILNWAAEGKTDSEIAIIINLSAPTVRYHWGNIFKKLNAHGRVYAISKAMKMGLVTPYGIGADRSAI